MAEDVNKKPLTPSEFYRRNRSEYFSDSRQIVQVELPKEVLAHELSLITTNLKTEEFETLCRRVAEKLIAPNLIPQVGPTGGGDGKTDFETYPVSDSISNRWFIPEQGWSRDEKWAFAISAKETWKAKAKTDIEKILGTEREYTRIYFITNQLPSSRERKETQDEFIQQYKIDIIILDGAWILDSIYANDLLDLAVDSLNLSESFKRRVTQFGKNDVARLKRLEELEKSIANPNRYFEYDHQIVEDALDAAILSRMLELPRNDVEGKFDRAIRFCEKGGNEKQLLRIHYQRAWTYINWYNDYSGFIKEYKICKTFVSILSTIGEIELLYNLVNILYGLEASGVCNLVVLGVRIDEESKNLNHMLSEIEKDQTKPCAALIAKTQKCLSGIMISATRGIDIKEYVNGLTFCVESCINLLDYPFETFKEVIQHLGSKFTDNSEFDRLFDSLAETSEIRSSELSAGQLFLNRGFQKLNAGRNKDAIIYFGKAIRKLAKQESEDDLYFALKGLGSSYESIGLLWASNNCYASALAISLKSWFERGIINERCYNCAKDLAKNELLLGRLPSFLNWHQLLVVMNQQLDVEKDQEIPFSQFCDSCLAIRILNTPDKNSEQFQTIPDLLMNEKLGISWLASQYRLGNIELIRDDLAQDGIKTDDEIDTFFNKLAAQPFKDQVYGDLNFMSGERIEITSTILGCVLQFKVEKDTELLITCEMLLAFVEGFLATSFDGIYPHAESILVNASKASTGDIFQLQETGVEYSLKINWIGASKTSITDSLIGFISKILSKNFHIDQFESRLKDLFVNEEVMERLSLISEHHKFVTNTLGSEPKLFYDDWIDSGHKVYDRKRAAIKIFKSPLRTTENIEPRRDSQTARHNERKVNSIIDVNLWNQAHWMGFGFFRLSTSRIAVFLGFENIDAGVKIFDGWRDKYGDEDKNEEIRVSIIKGVSKKNPFWYRVHITKRLDAEKLQEGIYLMSVSRYHELNADSDTNLRNLLSGISFCKEYLLIPAKLDPITKEVTPHAEKGILKRSLITRDAWEIPLHDLDVTVIRGDDDPLIPPEIKEPPVLEVIEWKRRTET